MTGKTVRPFVASVWLVHGLYNKLLGGSPRHLAIVQSVPGLAGAAGVRVFAVVGLFEVALAIWVLSGWARWRCATTQTVTLLSMNVVELTFARHLLLWPAGIYGMWILRRHPAAQLVMCSYAGYAVLAAFVTEDFYLRYRVPIETLLAAVAATGYCRWMQQLRRSAPGLTGESRHKKPSAEREGAGNEARPDECSTAGDDHCRADARGVSDRRRNGIEVGRDGVSGLPGSST